MEQKNAFLRAAEKRRSRYALTDKSPVSDGQIVRLVQELVRTAPSAFNSQGARVLVLFGDKHRAFWQLVREALQRIVPAEKFAPTEEKLASFAAAHGTVLFFEDWKTVEEQERKFPTYKEHFPMWAYQSNGMLEFMVWTAFAEWGLGASLQHYNPLVDEAVRRAFGVPESWKLLAQMPFGVPSAPAGEKTFLPLSERVKVLGEG